MAHYSHRANLTIVFTLVALMAAVSANAALLDCTQSQVVFSNEDCLAAGSLSRGNSTYGVTEVPVRAPVAAQPSDFQVNRNATSDIPGSVPLIGFICALLMVSLIKARAFNTK